MHVATVTHLALKEWGAAVAALLDGRQTVLLRKGGIHERAFVAAPSGVSERYALLPTVSHAHAARVRPEHQRLLARGAADVRTDAFVVRCLARTVGVVDVARPEGLEALTDLHIWTNDSVLADRVEFRPKHPLRVMVVAATELDEPVTVPRRDEHGGCRSWVDVTLPATLQGRQVHDDERLRDDLERVRAAVRPRAVE